MEDYNRAMLNIEKHEIVHIHRSVHGGMEIYVQVIAEIDRGWENEKMRDWA